MTDVVIWLTTLKALGLIGFPICYKLFHRLPDRGILFAMPLTMILLTYLLWLLALTNIVPYSRLTIIIVLILMGTVSLGLIWRNLAQILGFLKKYWAPILIGELIFVSLFLFWIILISFFPAINHTEKPMDFAFLNAVLNSTHFPPEDPWLSGHTISYYYFGHMIMATIVKITSISSNIGYNLSLALVPALVGLCAYSLAFNMLVKTKTVQLTAILVALLSPFMLTLIGNLEGILELIHSMHWGSIAFWDWASIKGLTGISQFPEAFFPTDGWWWWRATRIIDTVEAGRSLDYTITEFPFFSYLLGDLHAHMLAVPFVLMFLGLVLNLFLSHSRPAINWMTSSPWEFVTIALVMGSLAFINVWDYPIYVCLFAIVLLVKIAYSSNSSILLIAREWLLMVIPIVILSLVFFLPFYLTLDSQVSGFSVISTIGTRPFHMFLIFGLFMIALGPFVFMQLRSNVRCSMLNFRILLISLLITMCPLFLWTMCLIIPMPLVQRPESLVGISINKLVIMVPMIFIGSIILHSIIIRIHRLANKVVTFNLILLWWVLILLMTVELFYLSDMFGNRMNTVFKVYYQSWVLLALIAPFAAFYIYALPETQQCHVSRDQEPKQIAEVSTKWIVRILKNAWISTITVLILVSVYYPIGSIADRVQGSETNTLDGLAFLKVSGKSEYASIVWLREEAAKGRIVEAVGDSYSGFGRISGSTGNPTLLGWKSHEAQWRGHSELLAERELEAFTIYSDPDPHNVLNILNDRGIRYVYFGNRERNTYGKGYLGNFPFLSLAFEEGNVKIYEYNDYLERVT